jgi:hypothetical protein
VGVEIRGGSWGVEGGGGSGEWRLGLKVEMSNRMRGGS